MRETIGAYRILRLLGEGGMGTVYLGVHDHLGREVAIKVLAPELTWQPAFRERFFAEARVQARLHHTNIVTIHDLIEDGGEFFIVMEHVPGTTLEKLMAERGGGLGIEQTLELFRQVLEGLDYAHSKGVIHRDVKPSNILFGDGDLVKLTDFGIALLVGDKRLTASRFTIGTPTYMSPEQILRPRTVDHRTDIYSAAIVLFEMLAGRPPFDAESEYEIKKQQIEASIPEIREIVPEVPDGIAQALAIALRKDPEERFPSAGEFLRTLRPRGEMPSRPQESKAPPQAIVRTVKEKTDDPQMLLRGQGDRSSWRQAAAAVAAGILVIAALAVFPWSRKPASEPPQVQVAGASVPLSAGADPLPQSPPGALESSLPDSASQSDALTRVSAPPPSRETPEPLQTSREQSKPAPEPVQSVQKPTRQQSPDTGPKIPEAILKKFYKNRVEDIRQAIANGELKDSRQRIDTLRREVEGAAGFEGVRQSIDQLEAQLANAARASEQRAAARIGEEKIQQLHQLVHMKNYSEARKVAEEIIALPGVPETIAEEARSLASAAEGAKVEVIDPGSGIRNFAIQETGYKPSDGLLLRIYTISAPGSVSPGDLAFKVRYVALGPDPEENLTLKLSARVRREGDPTDWAAEKRIVAPLGGGIIDTPITLTIPRWAKKGDYILEITLEEKVYRAQTFKSVHIEVR